MNTNVAEIYLLRCLTNMHPGSGDENYGVIDNRVQRDVTTGFPAIFSSSLKGAIREFFDSASPYAKVDNRTHATVNSIFGSPANETDNLQQGNFRFLSAKLLGLPLKSNFRPFYTATCPAILKDIIDFINLVEWDLPKEDHAAIQKLIHEIDTKPLVADKINNTDKIFIEDFEVGTFTNAFSDNEKAILEKYIGTNIALFPDNIFINYAKELPVIARNQLENGQSQNLWYEEIIPRETRFWFGLIRPANNNLISDFERVILNNRIQIGANATIGYGITHIFKP